MDAPATPGTAPLVDGDGTGAPAGSVRGSAFRLVNVLSVEVTLPDQYPVVTLEEAEPRRRRLAFRIGMAEGAALAHALAGTEAPRPLPPDLFSQVIQRFGIEVVAVRLVGRRGSTYLAELDLVGPKGRELVSCRPSDGIALALRQRLPAPVLADERLLATAGDVTPD